MQKLIDLVNNNQGVVAVGIFALTVLLGWLSGFFRWVWLLIFGRKDSATKVFNQSGGNHSHNYQGENITISPAKEIDDK